MSFLKNNVINARFEISALSEEGLSVVVAVDFKNKAVRSVLPVLKNSKGGIKNESQIFNDLELWNCHPRKIEKQGVKGVIDFTNVYLLKSIA